ncbi:flavodoxin [uncultured Veillonella sp.]|uniref:flavodoxin n=1 Tax=uncultured Veillonella sp. TaxID=159268 RepID=UPI002619F26D|nr:flavodoxin [uncultured Veillonella sp.]
MNIKKILGLLVIVAVAIGLFSYNYVVGQKDSTKITTMSTNSERGGKEAQNLIGTNKKALVVYFSSTKGLYGGDKPAIGYTHSVANYIIEATGADEYEIVPAKEYPDNHQQTVDIAKAEQANNERPAIKNPFPDVSKYDVVFVGSPIWWYEYPMVVRTFLDQVDLNGKVVIPFTTHEGSGMGNTKEQLEKQYPNATVLDGIAIRGREATSEDSKIKVINWLKQIGIAK